MSEPLGMDQIFDMGEPMSFGRGEIPPEMMPPVNAGIPIEQHNLAKSLEAEELDKISRTCFEGFERDLESRSEWEKKHATWIELYYQTDKAKIPPWSGSSEESIPLLTDAVNQFHSRSYKAFFPTRYFIDCIPVGQSNEEVRKRAERVGKHMSYQLGVLDRTYKINKAQMFMAVALHGSDFTKTYFSPTKRRTIIERVRALDLVVPYGNGPRNIEDLERKTHIKTMSINDTRILQQLGWFIGEGTPMGLYDDGKNDTNSAVDRAEGLTSASIFTDKDTCQILEQHCLIDLDDDGIAEPYIVWIDRQSRKILRLQIRYEVDESGVATKGKEPIEYFTHYQFLSNPDGFYGLGFGHLLGQMNIAANKLQRMFIDANELSVVGNLTYLISEQLGIKGDDFELSLGRGIKIPRSVDDIRKHFTKLDFKPPSQETMQMLDLIQNRAAKLSSNSDILSGSPDKVYQPTTMLAMLEQGLQLFSSVQEFLGYALEDELQKVYRINAKYMQEDDYFIDGDQQITVTREDYQDDFRVVPVFDPKYTTRSQKVAKAEAEYNFIIQNPLTSQDQQAIYLASRNYLEAIDVENIDAKLKEPTNQQPARIDDQNLENTYFLMPPSHRPLFDVYPDQDHINHIKMIDRLLEWIDQAHPLDVPNPPMGDPQVSRLITTLSNDQKEELIANLLRHRTLHVAFMFGQLNGSMDQNGQPIGQAGAGGVETPPNNAAGMGAIIQALSALGKPSDVPDGQGGIPPGPSGDNQGFG